jgi:hypothetical protein
MNNNKKNPPDNNNEKQVEDKHSRHREYPLIREEMPATCKKKRSKY